MSDRRAYLAAKKRESRERARADHRCVICTTNPADAERATCGGCRKSVTSSRSGLRTWLDAVFASFASRAKLAGDETGSDRRFDEGRVSVSYDVHANGTVTWSLSFPKAVVRPRAARLPSTPWRATDPENVGRAIFDWYVRFVADEADD